MFGYDDENEVAYPLRKTNKMKSCGIMKMRYEQMTVLDIAANVFNSCSMTGELANNVNRNSGNSPGLR